MTTEKVTITLDKELLKRLRKRAIDQNRKLSNHIATVLMNEDKREQAGETR